MIIIIIVITRKTVPTVVQKHMHDVNIICGTKKTTLWEDTLNTRPFEKAVENMNVEK